MQAPRRPMNGFSLIELAIVIVVIGLLVGGITVGKAMIRVQGMRDLLTDAKSYAIAMQQFKDTYGYVAGDFPTAESVWGNAEGGAATTNCSTPLTSASPDGIKTCNGNGNGYADSTGETFWIWQQLSAAGLIGGKYTGVAGSGNVNDARSGVNVPGGAITGSQFWFYNWQVQAASSTFYAGDYTDAMVLGMQPGGSWPNKPLLLPKEAAEMDTKADDGAPGTGDLRTFTNTWETGQGGTCINSDDPTVATYVTTNTTAPGCVMLFLNTFQVKKR